MVIDTVPLQTQLHALFLDLVDARMTPVDEVLAQVEANGEVFRACVYLGLERLVVVEQKLDAAHVSRLVLVAHLSHLRLHPHHEVARHVEESVQVAHVVELMLALVDELLQVAPFVEHLEFAVPDLLGFVAGVQAVQLGGLLLDLMHFEA